MVHVQINGQFKNKAFVENVSELLVETILPVKLRRAVSVDVWIYNACLLYTSPSPRDRQKSRMPSSA